MKIIYVFLLLTVTACAQKIVHKKTDITLSQEELETFVVKELNIEESKIGFVVSKVSPGNSNETIVVIEEIAKEEEWSSESNSHIAIVDNTTGKITHKYFESSKTNGWDSDAIFMDNITIDTLNFKLDSSKTAFGVKGLFRSMSKPNPYYYETLSLFTKERDSLKKILDFYPIYESSGEVNVNSCYAHYDKTAKVLSMGDAKTNGYNDILVKHTISDIIYQEDENGDCNPTVRTVATESKVLAFNGAVYKEKYPITLATIDSVSLGEIKPYTDANLLTIFEHYKKEEIDEVEIWSDKMFGRCCTEADLEYSELLEFDITAKPSDEKYPFSNLSDKTYGTAFVFKENEEAEISIKLGRNENWHESQISLSVDEVLKDNDTLLKPFKLSLVNGYVKSEKTFKENGRVEELNVFLNNTLKGTIALLDTPLIQEFQLDFAFTKNDEVKLVPITYYKGTTYDDVCISEIQSSLAQITHPSINKKYKVLELRKIGKALKE